MWSLAHVFTWIIKNIKIQIYFCKKLHLNLNSDLNSEEIVRMFYEKELQWTNQGVKSWKSKKEKMYQPYVKWEKKFFLKDIFLTA